MADSKKTSPHRSGFYHRLANWYEAVFARFFRDRARAAIEALEIPAGAKVLEIGVGTGLSLAAYPNEAEVVGIDLSEEMLNHAREKIDAHGWNHIRLQQMDAQSLEFPDAHFDYVMAFHVVTVVPDHRKMMDEIVRVARPGATVVIINHFRSERRLVAKLVDALDPITRHLGWRTTLGLEDAFAEQPLEIEARYKTSPRSLFTVVRAKKRAS